MSEKKALIKGIETNFQIEGEGKPLLILHGWGSESGRWQNLAKLLAGIGLKVVIPDLPGFGKSQKPEKVWGLDDYCDFVEKFAAELNLKRFYLLGHSFGGAVAVKCCLKFPKRIEKLFLVDAACFRRKALRKKFFYLIAKILKVFSFLPFYFQIRKSFYKLLVGKSDYPYAEGVMKEIYLKIIKEDLSNILNKVRVPTIIIWGRKDKIKKVKEARLLKEKIKGSDLKIISNAGHSPHSEAPEKLLEIIIKSLR